MSAFREKYIGDKNFYKMVMAVAVPIMIQNGKKDLVYLAPYAQKSVLSHNWFSRMIILAFVPFYSLCISKTYLVTISNRRAKNHLCDFFLRNVKHIFQKILYSCPRDHRGERVPYET